MSSKLHGVILAGGNGTRLWPLSRSAYPKQFLTLNSKETMLQETAKRLKNLSLESLTVICNEEHRFLAAEQLLSINSFSSIMLEHEGKSTAPAVAIAAMRELENGDPLILVVSADHVIKNETSFLDSINSGIQLAEEGYLVIYGADPQDPNTNFGYIEKGKKLLMGFEVASFKEKPDLPTAMSYLNSKNNYYWNTGIFLFKASNYLKELRKFRPDIFDACENCLMQSKKDTDFFYLHKESYSLCPAESIDYAVMEHTKNAAMVIMDAGWNDLGTWKSLWENSKRDSENNAILGDVILHDTKNSYIKSEDRLVTACGINNLAIIALKDTVAVINKDNSNQISEIISKLKLDSREELNFHKEVFRPWGKYESIANAKNFQVKIITVKPKQKLSVQKHFKRSEHWIVISGTARVTCGEEIFDLTPNEHTFIPKEEIHALENPFNEILEIIEVQTGTYFGEDDIVRYEDIYGRIN